MKIWWKIRKYAPNEWLQGQVVFLFNWKNPVRSFSYFLQSESKI